MSARQRKRREYRRRGHSARETNARRLVAAGSVTAGATLAFSGVAQAAPMTFHVGNPGDPGGIASDCVSNPANTDCTLRDAINAANSNGDPGDLIVFNSSLSGQTINLDSGSGELQITGGVTIQGPGATQLTVDAGGNSRIFGINSSDPVSISGLTLTDGYTSASEGGAIFSQNADLTISQSAITYSYATNSGLHGGAIYSTLGSLTIDSSMISGNHAYYGGGVAGSDADVTITNSTLSGNYAYGVGSPTYDSAYGGGVWIEGAQLTVDRSTIDHNFAGYGGGIYMSSSGTTALTVKNSTIAANHAANRGGGIKTHSGSSSASTLTVVGSTVTGNTAGDVAGGIYALIPTDPVLESSIVSGNSAGPSTTDDLDAYAGHPFDASFSLIGVDGGYVSETVPGSNLPYGTDPQVGALQDNGGPTATELPANTSPVIDQGKAFSLATDQRGLTRPVDFSGVPNSSASGADGSDIGAVELQQTCAGQATPGGSCPSGGGGGATMTPTGKRAAAKKRCKKKFRHAPAKRRKCLKGANRLPV